MTSRALKLWGMGFVFLILAANPSLVDAAEWGRKAKFCARAALVLSGFGVGVYWENSRHLAPPENAVVTVADIATDSDQFAVVESRRVFYLDNGDIKDDSKKYIPHSEGTLSIASYKGHLLALNQYGSLTVYRPSTHAFVYLNAPKMKQVLTVEDTIVGVGLDGDLLVFTSPAGEKLGFKDRAPVVGGKEIKFEALDKNVEALFTQTADGFYRPATILAFGKNSYVFHANGKRELLAPDQARSLKELILQLQNP